MTILRPGDTHRSAPLTATLVVLLGSCFPAFSSETHLVNLDSAGALPPSTTIFSHALSGNGRYVAFASTRPYVGPSFSRGANLYVRDLALGTVVLVSRGPDGIPGNDSSQEFSLSDDGQLIVFSSSASNLVQYDTNNQQDVFLYAVRKDELTRISNGLGGEEATGRSGGPRISGDGSVITFVSNATELSGLPAQTNNLFIYEVESGAITSPNIDSDGNRRAFSLRSAAPNHDGNVIALNSTTSFDPRHDRNVGQIYVYDRTDDSFELISYDMSDDSASFGVGTQSAISGDARYVAFFSLEDLVPEDGDGSGDIMVRDRETGALWLATVTDDGSQTDAQPLDGMAISDDGMSVMFSSSSSAFSRVDGDNYADVFLYDRALRRTELISASTEGESANDIVSTRSIYDFSLSATGRYATFNTAADNLDPVSAIGRSNAFRRDRGAACGSTETPLTFSPEANRWYQLSIPCEAPPNANTVQDILGDDLNGAYGDTWVVFVYEPVDGVDGYRALALDDDMTPGQGFWFTQIEEQPVLLDMPDASRGLASNFDSGEACVSFTGCHSLPFTAENLGSVRWNMIGNPFPGMGGMRFGDIRLTADAGDCSADTGCSLEQAAALEFTNGQLLSWTGSSYRTYSAGSVVPPWTAGWLAELPNSYDMNATLQLPE